MKKVDRSFEWKMPTDFYGRVVDQDNKPIADANAECSWTDTSALGTSQVTLTSDQRGLFSLTGRTGKSLTIRVSKDGYHSSGGRGGQSFEYAAFFEGTYHRPNSKNPVTFLLIRKLDSEPLIARHLSERASYDHPNYYDLDRGTLTQQTPAGAGLRFTFERSESVQGQPFDWKWKVDAVNGELQETKDEFTPIAPENGYGPSWEMSQTARSQPFRQSGQARFYVRTAENRFARIDVELAHPNSRTLGPRLTLNLFLNPSGSRNLEYDPTKRASVR